MIQTSLFEPEVPTLEDATLSYQPDFFESQKADQLLQSLLSDISWREDHIRLYGRDVKIPRLQAWYGDLGTEYQYSGLTMNPKSWNSVLTYLREVLQEHLAVSFNSVLANHYRNGQDSIGMHADDEPELGPEPVIAALSFGEERNLQFKHKVTGKKFALPLKHGSLLVMSGQTQQFWMHGIAKSQRTMGDRVSLTFRQVNPGYKS